MTFNVDQKLAQMRADFAEPSTTGFQSQFSKPVSRRPGSSVNFFADIMSGNRFERQLDRLESLLDRFQSLLDRLSSDIGGAQTGGNGWQSGWSGGGNAEGSQAISGTGRIWGDPHFIGADGGKYDVQGEAGKTYNLLSDDGFQMNGRFDAWGGGGATVVGEVGINAKGDNINVKGDGSVSVNGQALADGQKVALTNGGYVEKNGDNITVKSGEWQVDFQAKDSSRGDYLNMDVKTNNAVADGVKPHGLLGQTFDGDGEARNGDKGKGAQGGGAIENLAIEMTDRGDKETIQSYEVSSLTDTEFTSFNRFQDFSGSSFDAQFDDFFAGGFDNGWGFSSSQDAMDAVTSAYGTLAQSMMSSYMNFGWNWNNRG